MFYIPKLLVVLELCIISKLLGVLKLGICIISTQPSRADISNLEMLFDGDVFGLEYGSVGQKRHRQMPQCVVTFSTSFNTWDGFGLTHVNLLLVLRRKALIKNLMHVHKSNIKMPSSSIWKIVHCHVMETTNAGHRGRFPSEKLV